MTFTCENLSIDDIKERLNSAQGKGTDTNYLVSPFPSEQVPGIIQPAAVLIPFVSVKDTWHILFIRRTVTLPEHSGQVAFPGGRLEKNDSSLVATALREAEEEIGLISSDVHILGQLDDFLTVTNYVVSPIVATIPWPYPINMQKEEVSHIFTIPLNWLADPKNHQIQMKKLSQIQSPTPVIFFDSYNGEILWGASARFIVSLIEILNN